jgi:hypothetical protein
MTRIAPDVPMVRAAILDCMALTPRLDIGPSATP